MQRAFALVKIDVPCAKEGFSFERSFYIRADFGGRFVERQGFNQLPASLQLAQTSGNRGVVGNEPLDFGLLSGPEFSVDEKNYWKRALFYEFCKGLEFRMGCGFEQFKQDHFDAIDSDAIGPHFVESDLFVFESPR